MTVPDPPPRPRPRLRPVRLRPYFYGGLAVALALCVTLALASALASGAADTYERFGMIFMQTVWAVFPASLIGSYFVAKSVERTRHRRWRRRLAAGQCITCGYDLRGNTTGICPECGTRTQSVLR
jgi:hypothetical protein